MINTSSSISRLQSLSPVRPSRPCESAAGDGFVASTGSSPGIYAPRASEEVAPTESTESLADKAMLATCLAVSGAAGVLAFVPSAAAAQVQVQPQRQVKDPALRQLLASSLVTGRVPAGTVEQRMAQLRPEVRQELQELPPQAQEAYVQLDPPARRWLSSQVSGSSDTLFGKVQHRKAFIRGKVAIFNLFDLIKSKIGDQVKSGAVPRQAQPRINAYLDNLKRLEPDQREAMADALQVEWSRGARVG